MKETENSAETRLNIRVNTFIINELYRLMGDDRNEQFREMNKKRAYKPLCDVIHVGKNKINRIINEGSNATIYSKTEVDGIIKLFNIDNTYFQLAGDIMKTGDLSLRDWKLFFDSRTEQQNSNKYKRNTKGISKKNKPLLYGREIKAGIKSEGEIVIEKVQYTLNNYVREYCRLYKMDMIGIRSEEEQREPLYRICYYYVHAKCLPDKTEQERIHEIVNRLKQFDYNDWISCGEHMSKVLPLSRTFLI